MVKIFTNKRKCPYCRGNVVKRGLYFTKSNPRKRQKYSCRQCGKFFTFRSKKYFKLHHPIKILKYIEKLSKTNKLFVNKYDNRKSLNYSSREISGIIKKRYRYHIAHSKVSGLIKRFKKYVQK